MDVCNSVSSLREDHVGDPWDPCEMSINIESRRKHIYEKLLTDWRRYKWWIAGINK